MFASSKSQKQIIINFSMIAPLQMVLSQKSLILLTDPLRQYQYLVRASTNTLKNGFLSKILHSEIYFNYLYIYPSNNIFYEYNLFFILKFNVYTSRFLSYFVDIAEVLQLKNIQVFVSSFFY